MKFKYNFKNDLAFYNELKSYACSAFKKGKIEKTLKYIYYTASYAWTVHTGIWSDDELENILFAIGTYHKSKKSEYAKEKLAKKKGHKIAYIASILRDVGGHNILLKHWIRILSEKFPHQELYITKIDKKPLRFPFMKKNLEENGVKIKELPRNASFLKKILNLKNIIEKSTPDTLIIFTHPNDVTLIPALSALSTKPHVIFFNHADHVFWLGKKLSDCVIEQRIDGAKFSKKYRKINVNQFIVPLTTEIKPEKVSKKIFGVPESSTLSISIGGIMKVEIPYEYNYYKTIETILKKFPNHYHMFVTDHPPKTLPDELSNSPDDLKKRFIINGPFPNLAPIYGAGDFLIDTFPVGGGMVIVDAMACGLPIVSLRNKEFSIVSDGGAEVPQDYPFITTDYNEFIDSISRLIENSQLRKISGKQLFDYYLENLSPNAIQTLLLNIINHDISNKLIFDNMHFDEAAFNYNAEMGQKSFLTARKNFLLLDVKHSCFSFMKRLKILTAAIKRKEFSSLKDIFVFALITTFRFAFSFLFRLFISQKLYPAELL